MRTVYYIIERHNNGKFKPFAATYAPGCALLVIASGETSTDLASAQRFLTDNAPAGPDVFPNPVKSSEDGLTWLSELIAANPGNQSKEEAARQLAEENS
jgi:hypothetical protein